jgi:hypothetical protein
MYLNSELDRKRERERVLFTALMIYSYEDAIHIFAVWVCGCCGWSKRMKNAFECGSGSIGSSLKSDY